PPPHTTPFPSTPLFRSPVSSTTRRLTTEDHPMPPALYLVSTPIGNLSDMTRRAVDVIRGADVVFAEDTRRTGVLLRHYGIEARLDRKSTRLNSSHVKIS